MERIAKNRNHHDPFQKARQYVLLFPSALVLARDISLVAYRYLGCALAPGIESRWRRFLQALFQTRQHMATYFVFPEV